MNLLKLFGLLLTRWIALSFASIKPELPWTKSELDAANTAATTNYLDSTEKQVFLYVNLARLYPSKFKLVEVQNYVGTIEQPLQYKNSANKQSLMRELSKMKPVGALLPDSMLTEIANCFSKELGESGRTGHDRKKCSEGYGAENCSFGKYRGKDIVLQLLIDEGVASLGHRKNCLSERYTLLGVSFTEHKKYKKCTVMDFK